MKGLSASGHSQSKTEMIKELRKGLNDNEIDLSNLYNLKNKCGRLLTLKFIKEDFILPTAYPCINKLVVNDIHVPTNLKAGKVPTPDNIKASLKNQIENTKNASINVKSLMVTHEIFLSYDNENMIAETYVIGLNENISIYGLIAFLGKTNNKTRNCI